MASKLGDFVKQVLRLDPKAPAIEFHEIWHSWGELARTSEAIDALLNETGLREGAAVGIFLRNRPPHIGALIGVVVSERCVVTMNPMLSTARVLEEIKSLKVPALIAAKDDWERPGFDEAVSETGALGLVLTGDPDRPVEVRPGLDVSQKPTAHKPMPGIAIEMLTSGTTGKPKRIPLALKNFESALFAALVYERDRRPDDPPRLRDRVTISHSSLVHISGMWGVFGTVLAGRKMCLLEKFNVPEWRSAVVRYRPVVASAPPAALRMILDADIPATDLSSLKALRSGTAPLSPDIVDAFLERYNLPVLENYGATEFAGGVAGWTLKDFRAHWAQKRGAVGRVHRGIEARIVDPESNRPLAPSEAGILEIRGSQIGDCTNWVRTTDRARMDKDNFLWILGRSDNAIIRGGFKVHPDDVVEALQSHEAVLEASVVGIPDQRLGAVPVAAIVLKEGVTAPSEDELKAWARDRLTPYQVPKKIKFVDELPRTPSLKVSQPLLLELFAEDREEVRTGAS